ncbi:hypothetical protein CP965_13775 [Halarcobacter mediterraneus]|uniref:DUF4381 domain-containing protein n=1 Tax=Halarcobacter mediterraneus TaxID=2023153 RepID=A0A4Q1B166_9BACT|nr:hypothetical protein [Halarcobacter mediterraneus]RXK11498.1 hypothetical protein CP965_13775 [Halarcobacter mediterraneus]
MQDLKIHDIKGLVEIPDFSICLYMLLWILASLLFLAFIYLVYKLIKNRKKNYRKEYYKNLKEIDFSNTKQSAYKITRYSRLLAQSLREKKLMEELLEALERYKYKKNVEQFDDEIKILYGRFMDNIDV